LDDFTNTVQEELSKHLVIQDEQVIVRAQASFESRSALVATSLRQGDRVVKRGRIQVDGDDDNSCAHVHQYWAAVASKLPLLAMIARILLACCASEAAVERMFSKEGFIHNSYRNRLDTDIMLALTTNIVYSFFKSMQVYQPLTESTLTPTLAWVTLTLAQNRVS
jgi:hypothetical protein